MTEPATETQSVVPTEATLANLSGTNPPIAEGPGSKPIPIKHQWFIGRTIAFAINDFSVEMAVVTSRPWKTQLVDCQKEYFSQKTEESKRIAAISDTIALYIQDHANPYSRICIALTGPETSYRTFLMPDLTPKQMATAIIYEIRKQLPFPIEDCNFDYRIFSSVTRGEQTKVTVSLAAATKRLVKRIMAPLELTGQSLTQVYNAPEAVGQLLRYLPDFEPNKTYALISVDRDQTLLSYYHGTDLIFYHYASLGSAIIVNRTDSQRFDDFAQLLAGEVQNSLDYYAGQLSSGFDNKLYLHGDMAYSDELIMQMKSHLGFEFRRFPAETLSFVSETQKIELVGLSASVPALAAAVCQHRIANLLPPERIEKNQKQTMNRLASAGLSVIAILLALLWVGQRMDNQRVQESLDTVNLTLEQFQASDIAAKLDQVKLELAAEQAYVTNAKPEISWVGLNLKDLSLITPPNIKLQSIEIDRRDPLNPFWRIIGRAVSDETPNEIIVADYVEKLERSSFFTNVTLERYRKHDTKTGFELEFELKAGNAL